MKSLFNSLIPCYALVSVTTQASQGATHESGAPCSKIILNQSPMKLFVAGAVNTQSNFISEVKECTGHCVFALCN